MPLDKPFSMRTSGFNIIDRRPTTTNQPGGKSQANVQRMMRRLSADVKKKLIEQGIQNSKIVGGDQDNVVIDVPTDKLAEPIFRHGSGGERDYVLPGNKIYQVGDKIKRSGGKGGGGSQGQGGGQGQQGQGSTSGESGESQTVQVSISREEFNKIKYEGMSLPNLEDVQGHISETKLQRAGYSTSGSTQNLNLVKTYRNSVARNKVLKRPNTALFEAEKEKLETLKQAGDEAAIAEQQLIVERMQRKRNAFSMIDPVDQRFNRFEHVQKPNTDAIMYCLRDDSPSMGKHEQMMAKAFFNAQYDFLKQVYKSVAMVYVCHTEQAKVTTDENEFFGTTMQGSGTNVSTAFKAAEEHHAKKHAGKQTNVYMSYVGDGDNSEGTGIAAKATKSFMKATKCKYGVYFEIKQPGYAPTSLMKEFKAVQAEPEFKDKFALEQGNDITHIHPAMRRMFTFKQPGDRRMAIGPLPTAATAYAASTGP